MIPFAELEVCEREHPGGSSRVRESLTQGTAPRRGWSVLALALASAALGALFGVLNHFEPAGSVAFWFNLVIPLAFSAPGAVLVGYRPANPIGWILATVGLTSGVTLLLAEYGEYAIRTNPGSVPGGVLTLWLAAVFGLPTLGLVPLLFLLFPDGSLPSPRWRPVAWVAVTAMAGFIAAGAFSPGPIGGDPFPGAPQNPVGITPARQLLELIGGIAFLVIPAVTVLALLAPVLRFRRTQGVERQQLKWFAFGAFLLVAGGAALFVPLSEGVAKAIVAAGLGGFTAAVAVAVLRYGLYEIDVIINRTLVYGLLTVLLGLGYAGAVLVGGQLAGQERSNLVVAGSTLAVAAVFRPARRRVQAGVDRRFNRRKYDAAKTVEAFSTRLRDQVDLDTLAAELLAVADQTMQPTRASLWLRPSTQPPARGQSR
jgi:hypothetical protein